MKPAKTDGFTIIELMVGIIGFGIIALAVGSMLVFGWMSWRRNAESVQMQRNAMVAARVIEHGIRNADPSQVTWDANGIYFTKADDSDFETMEFTAGALVVVDSFAVSTNAAEGIDVTFGLSTVSGSDEDTYQMTIYPRNQP